LVTHRVPSWNHARASLSLPSFPPGSQSTPFKHPTPKNTDSVFGTSKILCTTPFACNDSPCSLLEPCACLTQLAQLCCHDCQAAVQVGAAAVGDLAAPLDAIRPQVPA
jgi:hypothetical protein